MKKTFLSLSLSLFNERALPCVNPSVLSSRYRLAWDPSTFRDHACARAQDAKNNAGSTFMVNRLFKPCCVRTLRYEDTILSGRTRPTQKNDPSSHDGKTGANRAATLHILRNGHPR